MNWIPNTCTHIRFFFAGERRTKRDTVSGVPASGVVPIQKAEDAGSLRQVGIHWHPVLAYRRRVQRSGRHPQGNSFDWISHFSDVLPWWSIGILKGMIQILDYIVRFLVCVLRPLPLGTSTRRGSLLRSPKIVHYDCSTLIFHIAIVSLVQCFLTWNR